MSLFDRLRPQQPQAQQSQPQNPIFQMFGGMQQFQQNFNMFAQSIANQGTDPKQVVQSLLDSGKMTQDQFNQLSQMANMITGSRKF